jgi:mono/diheme cytochrome c family protein
VTCTRLILVGVLASTAACRGQVSEEPPVRIIPDMQWQPKYMPQGETATFPDKRQERTPVEGTVARGELREDDAFYRGKQGEAFINKVPVPVNAETIRRGQERFNIYCTPCHDQTGSGNGLAVQHGFPKPVSLHEDHAMGLPDGEVFSIITNGQRNMPSYAAQIPEKDRWAIVSWVRVIQRSQHTTLADLDRLEKDRPESEKKLRRSVEEPPKEPVQ